MDKMQGGGDTEQRNCTKRGRGVFRIIAILCAAKNLLTDQCYLRD